ncbi:Ribosomal protein L39e [Entamoeba marina]
MSNIKDHKLRILKEFSNYRWTRALYVSEVSTSPYVSSLQKCEIKIRYRDKVTSSGSKYEFMWTFSTDDSDFIEIVYVPSTEDEEIGHDITVNTPLEEGWGSVVFNSLILTLYTKSEIENAAHECRTLHFKFDKISHSKDEQSVVAVVIMEMSSSGKSYMKSGSMTSLPKEEGESNTMTLE